VSGSSLAIKRPANDSCPAVDEAQASGLFSEYMLMELVLEVARSSHDPQGRLADLFDRIAARARRGGIAAEHNSVMMQFRKRAENFFVLAGKNV